mmetsp:Transcript_13942/g.43217  ORF Transcript_13942/g.43217 Transcript_13942/m.43217 type:complete len:105 (+) Transcript_13942:133-447(+)
MRISLLVAIAAQAAAFTSRAPPLRAAARPLARSARVRMGLFDSLFKKKSNKDFYKPKLGGRVDSAMETFVEPQKGPSLDLGNAKMVSFYAVLAAAVGLALAYQP